MLIFPSKISSSVNWTWVGGEVKNPKDFPLVLFPGNWLCSVNRPFKGESRMEHHYAFLYGVSVIGHTVLAMQTPKYIQQSLVEVFKKQLKWIVFINFSWSHKWKSGRGLDGSLLDTLCLLCVFINIKLPPDGPFCSRLLWTWLHHLQVMYQHNQWCTSPSTLTYSHRMKLSGS